MKIDCDRAKLTAAMSLANKNLDSTPVNPILYNVLLDARDGQLSIIGTDRAMEVIATIEAEVESEGKVCVPAKLCADILSKMPSERVTACLGNNTKVVWAGESSKLSTPSQPPEEYEANRLPRDEGAIATLDIPADVLSRAIANVFFAVSKDETKRVLTGLHLEIGPNGLDSVGTDGHRLARWQWEPEEGQPALSEKELELNIPYKAVTQLSNHIAAAKPGTIGISCTQFSATFKCGHIVLSTRLLDGNYPNYRQLVPTSFTASVNLPRQELINRLACASIVSAARNNIFKLGFGKDDDHIHIRADAPDVGDFSDIVPAKIRAEASLEIGLNCKYVSEALARMSSMDVAIEMNTATSPLIISPVGGDNHICLIMPMQIRN
jgi:DNA polymerase-3 subunit beta